MVLVAKFFIKNREMLIEGKKDSKKTFHKPLYIDKKEKLLTSN